MAYFSDQVSNDSSDKGVKMFLWVEKEFDKHGFKKELDDILYRGYRIYKEAGDSKKSDYYKNRLLKEFPDSFWADFARKGF